MRLLIGSTDVPPDPAGSPYQRSNYALATVLARRGHDVSFWAVTTDEAQAARSRAALAGTGVRLRVHAPARVNQSRLRRIPTTLRRPFGASIGAGLRDEFGRALDAGYDVMQIENLQWAGYLGVGVPRCVVSVHMLNSIDLRGTAFRSWDALKTRVMTAYGERNLLQRFSHVRVLTDELADAVQTINPRAQTFTVPIAIDPTAYPRVPPASGRVVGLIAGMRWEHSRQAAVRLMTRIWPRVRRHVPDAQLVIAGWGAREALAPHVDAGGITLWEDLADAVDLFRRSTVFAYPLPAGGGLKGKILEAMAYGVPIVTTTAGMKGIKATNGEHGFIEDEDEPFASRVIDLLEKPALRLEMTHAARALVEARYAPEPVASQMEAVYREVQRG